MAVRTISTRLAVEGEDAYRQAITNINSELKAHRSQLKEVKSEYQNHQNSLDALQKKEEALAKVQGDLKNKLEECQKGYQNARSALENYRTQQTSLESALKKNEAALSQLDSGTKASGEQWVAYNTKIQDAEKQLKVLESTSGDTSEQEAKLKQSIAEAKEAMAKLEEETGGAAKTAGELIEENQRLTSQLKDNEAGQTAATKACNDWQASESKAKIELNDVNAQLELNEKYLDEAKKSADGCATSIDEFGKQSKEAGNESSQAMQAVYSSIVALGLTRAIKEVADALAGCVEKAAAFESGMATVQALSGATAKELEELTATAKEMGETTSFTAEEAAEALEYMAMAGWSADDSMTALPGVLNLAAAASMDLGEASDIVTDYLTAFGLSVNDAETFVDQLAYAATSSNTTVEQLGEAYKNCAATAGSMGYSVEDVTAVLMTMADAGVKGGEAGTTLNAIMTRLATNTKGCATELAGYGVEIYDSQGNMNDLSDILGGLSDIWADLTDEEAANLAKTIAGTSQYSGLQTIMNGLSASTQATGKSFYDYSAALSACSGTAASIAETKLDNLSGKMTLLNSATDGLSISVGNVLSPALGKLADAATGVINKITSVVDEHPILVAAVTGLAVALGVAVVAVAGLAAGCYALVPAIKAVAAAASANPVGMIVTGVAAAASGIAALIGVITSYNEAQMVLSNAAEDLKEQFEETATAYDELTEANSEAAENTTALSDELNALMKQESLTSAEQERAKYLIDQLNEAVPDLALAYDDETDSINMTADALDEMVEAQNAATEYEASVDRMNELYNEQATIVANLEEAQEALLEDESSKDAQEAIETYTAMLEENEAELAEVTAAVDAYNAAQEEADDSTSEATTAVEALASELISLESEYNDAYDAALQSIQGQIDLWDKMDEVTATSTDDIMAAIDSQIGYWTSYADNLDLLMGRNINGLDEFVSAIDDGSTESASYIAGMVDMSDEELQQLIDKYGDLQGEQERVAGSVAGMQTNYSQTLSSLVTDCAKKIKNLNLSDEAKEAALNTLIGYREGIDEESGEVDEEILQVADEAIEQFKEQLGIQSPSTVFQEIGENTIEGYTQGINGESNTVNNALATLASDAVKAFMGVANGSSLKKTGSETIEGYTSGVKEKSTSASSTMSSLASSALTNFKNKSTSTSLKTTGNDTIQGYVNGVKSQEEIAKTKMTSLANAAITKFRNASTSSSLKTAGSNTIQGYIDGLNNKSGSLYSKMTSIANTAISRFKKTLGIASPSKVFEELAGYTAEGYVEGLEAQERNVTGAMETMAQAASQAFSSYLSYDLDDYENTVAAAYSLQPDISDWSDDSDKIVQVEIPIYVDGGYSKTEIVEIALKGLSRKQAARAAVKGATA